MPLTKFDVTEIFQSLQGEGYWQGRSAVFVRFAGCNMACSYCDTEFGHVEYQLTTSELVEHCSQFKSRFVVFTGGEPSLQLTPELVDLFRDKGWYTAIETNGSKSLSHLPMLDYVSVSPKVSAKFLSQNFESVNEIRFPMGKRFKPPKVEDLPPADNYYLSPIDIKTENIRRAVYLCKENPQWRLSLQIHKVINIR